MQDSKIKIQNELFNIFKLDHSVIFLGSLFQMLDFFFNHPFYMYGTQDYITNMSLPTDEIPLKLRGLFNGHCSCLKWYVWYESKKPWILDKTSNAVLQFYSTAMHSLLRYIQPLPCTISQRERDSLHVFRLSKTSSLWDSKSK